MENSSSRVIAPSLLLFAILYGGMVPLAAVKKARKDHRRMAEKPIRVAVERAGDAMARCSYRGGPRLSNRSCAG